MILYAKGDPVEGLRTLLPSLKQVHIKDAIAAEVPGTWGTEVVVGTDHGLKRTSAVNLDNVATVPKTGLRSFVGVAPPEVMARVREALLFALGFDM